MPFPIPYCQAAANVDADATTPAFLGQRGFSDLERIGAGVYDLTFDTQIDPEECVVMATLNEVGAAPGASSIDVSKSDSEIRVTTKTLGVAADLDFSVIVFPLSE